MCTNLQAEVPLNPIDEERIMLKNCIKRQSHPCHSTESLSKLHYSSFIIFVFPLEVISTIAKPSKEYFLPP